MIEVNLSREVFMTFMGLLALIAVNTLLGILRAFVNGEFDVRHLPDFLRQHVLFDAGGLSVLALVSTVQPEIQGVFYASSGFLAVKYLAKIKDKLFAMKML